MPQSLHRPGNPIGVLTSWDRAGFNVSAERRGVAGTVGGGDFCTLVVRVPGHIGVLIGDTCGRGADGEAELSKIIPRIHDLALSGAGPSELLLELNRAVAAKLSTDRFVTAAAFEFDMRSGVFTVANAAHVPAIVRRARDRHVSIVGNASGMPLGITDGAAYVDEQHELNQGDVFVLMTDGMLEAVESDLLGMTTLTQLLTEASERAGDVHRFLLQRFEESTIGKRADDMTLITLEAAPEPISRSLLDFSRVN